MLTQKQKCNDEDHKKQGQFLIVYQSFCDVIAVVADAIPILFYSRMSTWRRWCSGLGQ